MKKIIKNIFLFILLFLVLITNASALDSNIDLTKKGSINIVLKEIQENKLIDKAEITIYHIASAGIIDNNLVFIKRNELSCSANLNNFEDSKLIPQIENCINEDVIKYISTTNDGKVEFKNLEQGLYLVSETKGIKGYSNFTPFLVAIPNIESERYIYNINATPKIDIYEVIDLVIEKKWNIISNNIPKFVNIELYNEDKLIDTIKLSNENNWTYTFKNIKKSDKYSIKEINIPKGFTPSYEKSENIFTVTNSDVLANTGKIFYPIIIFFSVGTLFIFLGIKSIKRNL